MLHFCLLIVSFVWKRFSQFKCFRHKLGALFRALGSLLHPFEASEVSFEQLPTIEQMAAIYYGKSVKELWSCKLEVMQPDGSFTYVSFDKFKSEVEKRKFWAFPCFKKGKVLYWLNPKNPANQSDLMKALSFQSALLTRRSELNPFEEERHITWASHVAFLTYTEVENINGSLKS